MPARQGGADGPGRPPEDAARPGGAACSAVACPSRDAAARGAGSLAAGPALQRGYPGTRARIHAIGSSTQAWDTRSSWTRSGSVAKNTTSPGTNFDGVRRVKPTPRAFSRSCKDLVIGRRGFRIGAEEERGLAVARDPVGEPVLLGVDGVEKHQAPDPILARRRRPRHRPRHCSRRYRRRADRHAREGRPRLRVTEDRRHLRGCLVEIPGEGTGRPEIARARIRSHRTRIAARAAPR